MAVLFTLDFLDILIFPKCGYLFNGERETGASEKLLGSQIPAPRTEVEWGPWEDSDAIHQRFG